MTSKIIKSSAKYLTIAAGVAVIGGFALMGMGNTAEGSGCEAGEVRYYNTATHTVVDARNGDSDVQYQICLERSCSGSPTAWYRHHDDAPDPDDSN